MQASLARLTWPELMTLRAKLGRARRQVLRAVLRAGSLRQAWDMIRVHDELTGLADDVDRELGRCLPPWLPP